MAFGIFTKSIHLDILALGPDALPELLTAARQFGFAGLNITYPCKQAIIPLLDDLTPDARALGAVNSVVFSQAERSGTTPIGPALPKVSPVNCQTPRAIASCRLVPAGAGAAVAHALLTLEAGELAIFDVELHRADRLARALCERFGAGRARAVSDLEAAALRADGIVNTTPVGMAKHPGTPVPTELLRPEVWVADIVYFPLETELLRAARGIGCRTMGGGGMAVYQAVGAFRLFTVEPDAERMRQHFHTM